MSALVELTQFGVRTNSRTVADVFEKQHKDVLRTIDSLLEKRPDLRQRNFAPSLETTKAGFADRQIRCYEMDRDGFTLVAMGFTGEKALDWKLAYIDAFNRMEEMLADGGALPEHGRFHVPQLGTRDDREAIRVGVLMVREARVLYGQQAGRQMWQHLGFPVPNVELAPAPVGPGELMEQPEGNLIEWERAVGLKDSKDQATSEMELYRSYVAWCAEVKLKAMGPDRFSRGVTFMFGHEEHPEMMRCIITRRNI